MSGVALGLGRGVLGVSCGADTVDAFLTASGKSSGRLACDDEAVNRFSDIVFNKFLPASLVCNKRSEKPSEQIIVEKTSFISYIHN